MLILVLMMNFVIPVIHIMVIFVVIFRLAVMPRYLQSYLNMAYTKLEELKQEAGKVSNLELQKMIARVFYYTTVVSSFLIF